MPDARAASAPPSRARLIFALVALAVTVAITVSLGRWQLSRADEKRGLVAQVEAGRQQAPLTLGADTPSHALVAWRPAVAQGRWLDAYTVLVDNRAYQGRPGYWVVTPLCLDAAAHAGEPLASAGVSVTAPSAAAPCAAAIAVLRGWLPRSMTVQPQAPASPQGLQTVSGELLSHVPRLFELPQLRPDHARGQLPQDWTTGASVVTQNLALDGYTQATGLNLLPAVLQQTDTPLPHEMSTPGVAPGAFGAPAQDTLVRDWAGPPSDVDKNLGYALQWFAFAAIAAVAWGVIVVKALRRRR